MGNVASSLPVGAHSSLLNTTLSCLSPGSSTPQLVPFDISATAPLSANSEFNFTDIQAHAYFPASPYQLILETTIYFSTDADPPTFSLFSARNVAYIDSAAYVPVSGVATAGPFRNIKDLANLRVDYLTAHAFNADIDQRANCTLPEHVLLSVANDKLSSANTAPAFGARATFPDTPEGSKSEIANFDVSCVETPYNFSLQATVPAQVKANSKYNVSNVGTFITFNTGSDTAYVAQYGVNYEEQILGISLTYNNSAYPFTDVARDYRPTDPDTSKPLSGGRYTDGTPQSLTIAAPRIGSLTGTQTAGSVVGDLITSTFRVFSGTLYSSSSKANFYCYNASTNALLTAPIV